MIEKAPTKRSVRLNTVTHSVRAAQTVLQYGVGAMVDFADQTLMTAAPEHWKDIDYSVDPVIHIHDERLEKILNVDYFGMPKDKDEYRSGIAYVRFPQWYFCPKCRRFQPLNKWITEHRKVARNKEKDADMKRPKCIECKAELVPARIVIACESGHIDDFPWILWTHEKSFGGRRDICGNPEIKFSTGTTSSSGLEGLVVKCNCGAMTTLEGAFNKDALQKFYSCTGFMPWKNQREACHAIPQVVQRGASKVYFPKNASSLVIPPYSDRANSLIENSQEYNKCLDRIEDYDGDEKEIFIESKLEKWTLTIANEIQIDSQLVKNILRRRLLSNRNEETCDVTTNVKYRIEEYAALTGDIPQYGMDEHDFIREKMDSDSYSMPGINQVVLIHKVREVRALIGFSRLNPPDAFNINSSESAFGLMSTKESENRWYPGYEVRGEGIFINFNDKEIEEWIAKNIKVVNRTFKLNQNYSMTLMSKHTPRKITPKFIFLHTMAHLLIRQLSFECGYTTASLRERIYCDTGEEDIKMNGIFIYTASGDSEGTLGGLVRQGYPDCLPQILRKALLGAQLCSNDPVCIESAGQGREALNLAACHSCLLLPETSCEEFNVFLDRGLVVGTLKDQALGFYSGWLSRK